VTQDDLLYRFRPRVFAITAELGTVRAACRTMGIHPFDILLLEAGPPRPEILAQSPAATCRCRRLKGRRCAFSPAEIIDLTEAIHARYRALVFVGAHSGSRIGELAGLRQSRVDLLAEAITVAETLRRRFAPFTSAGWLIRLAAASGFGSVPPFVTGTSRRPARLVPDLGSWTAA
jgi:integrase